MTDELASRDQPVETSEEAGGYRCVCGGLLPVGGTQCPGCGRRYDSQVLNAATAATTEFDPDQSVSGAVRVGRGDLADDVYVDQRLGHFKILEPIGRGGMGSVYRALDESLERYVAVKVLRPSAIGGDDSRLQRLFQEARAQARVNHPHVAHTYYVGLQDETPYLAMELVGKDSLADRLSRGSLRFSETARFALQIASALQAASGYDIVHGDVKPANMLMLDDSTVKLSDFGLASRVSGTGEDSVAIAGTPNYMPPEAMNGGVDHRGDMYSLGVALFEMTFGRLPYEQSRKAFQSSSAGRGAKPGSGTTGSDLQLVMKLHREAAIEFPQPWPEELPEQWREILKTLLAKDPDDRFRSFAELGNALQAVQPTALPSARFLLRALAWGADLFVIAMPLVLFATIPRLAGNPGWLQMLQCAASAAWLASIAAIQVATGTTPGKKLFQVRIVDQHGLKPSRSALGGRAFFQFAVPWAASVFDALLDLVSLGSIAGIFTVIAILLLVTEVLMVIARRGRSLHDRIFKTRVTLDA